MKRKIFVNQKNSAPITSCVCVGTAVSVVLSVILSLLVTSLTLKGSIGEDKVNFYVWLTRLLSVLLGSLIASGMSKKIGIPIIGAVSACYLLILLSVGILFYDGGVHRFGSGFISVLVGGLAASAIRLIPQNRAKYVTKLLK